MNMISRANSLTKLRAGRAVATIGLFCAAVLWSAGPAKAQQFTYNNFNTSAGIQLNGSAATANNGTSQVLRLTPASLDQVGTAWYGTQISLVKGFSTTFRFQITPSVPPTPGAGDGFAFVIQNGSFCNGTSGVTANIGVAPGGACGAMSGEGGSLGYITLTHSIAFEFDTFQNLGYDDNSGDEVGIQSCGASPNTVDHTPSTGCNLGQVNLSALPSPINLSDGAVHTATIAYSPGSFCNELSCTLFVTIDGQLVLSADVDLATLGLDANDDAYIGFTAATGGFGGNDDNQDILSWSFDTVQTQIMGAPGTTTTFTFNTDTYKITGLDNEGGEILNVDAFAVPATLFPAFAGFAGETCVPYADYSTGGVDTCIEFQVHCQVSALNSSPCSFNYLVATGYGLPADLSGGIGGPDFLVAHGVDCVLTSTSPVQSIFYSYQPNVEDPTTRGGSKGPSCFVATYHPAAAPITTGVGFAGWALPVINTDLNQVKAGSTRPLIFQFFDSLGNPVTNLAFCTSFTGTVCNDAGVGLPWINISSFGIACQSGAAVNPATDGTVSAAGNSGFQNNGGGNYQLNWQTLKTWKGSCANVQVTYSTGGTTNAVVIPAIAGFQFN